ncbi:MAG: glutathione peroxidase [Candidatus Sericytochromatia bacterium]|jgi:glutathione peroxidase|nr:glutathione peroxidase [Candidatus Sericytochromatia bacterium]
MSPSIYQFEVKNIQGETVPLETYQGKVLLIVNTASKCGFTPQYDGLEKIYKEYQAQGLEILGFPCNQFGAQEPGSEAEIASFCQLNYGVSFPMFAKIDVNGSHSHPLYDYLKTQAPGLLGSKDVKWNFTKFLVDANGKVIKRYAPQDSPESIGRELKKYLPK